MTKFLGYIIAGALVLSACSQSANSPQVAAANAQANGVIRTQATLNEYLQTTPRGASPLDALSPAGRARFLSSLTFSPKGVSTFRYDDLQAELSPHQVFEILALFGLQRDAPLITPNACPRDGIGNADHCNYECAARGTCAPASKLICTGNC